MQEPAGFLLRIWEEWTRNISAPENPLEQELFKMWNSKSTLNQKRKKKARMEKEKEQEPWHQTFVQLSNNQRKSYQEKKKGIAMACEQQLQARLTPSGYLNGVIPNRSFRVWF